MFVRLLDWVERDTRKKHDRIVVFKNMFDIADFEVCVACFIEFTLMMLSLLQHVSCGKVRLLYGKFVECGEILK